MPVKAERGWLIPANFRKTHLRAIPGIDCPAVDRQLLFEYPQFLKPFRILESDNVLIRLRPQVDRDFKSHGYIRATA